MQLFASTRGFVQTRRLQAQDSPTRLRLLHRRPHERVPLVERRTEKRLECRKEAMRDHPEYCNHSG